MKVCFKTFGCRLNKAEALQMEADYLAAGWETTDDPAAADQIVIRGCSVTARAQEDCENLISRLRQSHPNATLKVCGCLPNLPNPPNLPNLPSLPTRTARAYLKVQDGCSGTCSFCIVPQFRGKSVSVPFADVLDKARRFVEAGYHEIVVTGCNLALYASHGQRLPDLLSALARIDAGCRIRLGSVEPGSCALETIRAMAESRNICRFLHLPVQSGSPSVLKAMRRPYALEDIVRATILARQLMPDLGLGCDVIAGFPGETDDDLAATRKLLLDERFNNAHVFPYSERPGTSAALLPQVQRAVRLTRAHAISQALQDIRQTFARSFVGKTVEIVVEDRERCTGWTGEYLRCEAPEPAQRKSLVRIRVTAAHGDRLVGRTL